MNEIFGLAPHSLATANEYRLLLNYFGPHNSKYLLAYPDFPSWQSLILQHFENARDIEKERIKAVLRKGKEEHIFIASGRSGFFQQDIPWTQNAIKHWMKQDADHQCIFTSENELAALKPELNEQEFKRLSSAFENPPTAGIDEFIESTPEAYWRICKILCLLSREIHIIDPYLNPLKKDYQSIFLKLIKEMSALKKIQTINFWIRLSNVNKYDSDYAQKIQKISHSSINKEDNKNITINLISDETSSDKIHARYLITNIGGVKLDQGFQQLPTGRKNLASTISSKIQQEIFGKFSTNNFDFKITERIRIG